MKLPRPTLKRVLFALFLAAWSAYAATCFFGGTRQLSSWGIDLPAIVSFLLAVLLAVIFNNWLVPKIMETAYELSIKDRPTAQMVGRLEQIIYVYACMEYRDPLIAGWLILKAFYAWIPLEEPEKLRRFHAYLLGNGYSLLIGLAFGIFAQHLATILRLCQ